MIKLAESSGTVIHENDHKLYISKRPAQWTGTFLFVTGLLALIMLANGLMQFFLFKTPDHTIGFILLGLGLLMAFISWRVSTFRRKVNARPVDQLQHTCIIDLQKNQLLDGDQQLLAALPDVRLRRKMQVSSSAPKLLLSWSNKDITLVEGNPFSGGIAAVEKTLISRGIKTS